MEMSVGKNGNIGGKERFEWWVWDPFEGYLCFSGNGITLLAKSIFDKIGKT